MSKKPRATVTITAKLSPELAEEFYKTVNAEFEGNVSEAMRQMIRFYHKSTAKATSRST